MQPNGLADAKVSLLSASSEPTSNDNGNNSGNGLDEKYPPVVSERDKLSPSSSSLVSDQPPAPTTGRGFAGPKRSKPVVSGPDFDISACDEFLTKGDKVDDSLLVKSMDGYKFSPCREFFHWCLAVCTGFLSLLVAHWFPDRYIKYRYERCHLSEAEYVHVWPLTNDAEFVPVERIVVEPHSDKPPKMCDDRKQERMSVCPSVRACCVVRIIPLTDSLTHSSSCPSQDYPQFHWLNV